MNPAQRDFLESLLRTPSPAGFETRGQRVWVDYVREFVDDVRVDDYGNAVAVHEGSVDDPKIALTGHADEIGYIVRRFEEDGFLRISPIGGADRTVSKGQHVTVHADDPVAGVVGQLAIHLRTADEEAYEDLEAQFVDVGATSEEEARELVDVGDPVTVNTTVQQLHGTRIAARGMDNSVGMWAAAEGLRRAVETDVAATVYAVSTVQEELGLRGARMVGFDLAPDAVVTVDVTHATDTPDVPDKQQGPVELGGGPVVGRGSSNHPTLVRLAREAAEEAAVDVQLEALGILSGTDADAFYTARGGIPSLSLSIPNRYMHTPVEVVDADDLDDLVVLLGSLTAVAADADGFGVDI
ncbi:MAG: M42 family peptidase [Halobacteriota archaeon]